MRALCVHRPFATVALAILAAVWALAAAEFPTNARAQQQIVDRVVAVVEDDAILQSDVDRAVAQYLLQTGATNPTQEQREELAKEALNELINNKLVVVKASELGISVSFSEVEDAVDRAIEENKQAMGGEEAFRRQLEAENLTMDSLRRLYREQIQNRMLVERVLAGQIDRSEIQISDEELRTAYEEKKSQLPTRPAVVHLATIFVGLDSSAGARDAAKAQIDEIHRRILAGEDFGELAKEFSEDPSAEAGGKLGKLKLSDLSNRAFADAAAALEVGEVSDPVLTPYGYHIIQVNGKDESTGEVDLSHILVRIKAGDTDIDDVFKLANEVHDKLVAGEPFDSMAVKYSTDTNTASQGGDLGWLRAEDLPEFFQDVLKEMSPGEISPVLREPSGFRIVKLLEREQARPYDFEEVRDELQNLLEQEKMASMYDGYLETLRGEFYVEVRDR
jgi:peptidyl-prolyl cis-trans isomerase SurA